MDMRQQKSFMDKLWTKGWDLMIREWVLENESKKGDFIGWQFLRVMFRDPDVAEIMNRIWAICAKDLFIDIERLGWVKWSRTIQDKDVKQVEIPLSQ